MDEGSEGDMGEGVGSHTEREVVERIKNAADAYNKEVEKAKALSIKVTTIPHPYGKFEIRMIQVFRELYKGDTNG